MDLHAALTSDDQRGLQIWIENKGMLWTCICFNHSIRVAATSLLQFHLLALIIS